MGWTPQELINTLSKDVKVTPMSRGDHALAQQRPVDCESNRYTLWLEERWWACITLKRRSILTKGSSPDFLQHELKPVIYLKVWHTYICFFKYRGVSRGESVGMDATQMNSGIKWQQRSHSSGFHVSWRATKETRASLSASTMNYTMITMKQLLLWTWMRFFATTNAIFAYYHSAFFPHHISQMVKLTNNRLQEVAFSQCSEKSLNYCSAQITNITSDKVWKWLRCSASLQS